MEQTASSSPTVQVQEIIDRIRRQIAKRKRPANTPGRLERIDRYVLEIETEGITPRKKI